MTPKSIEREDTVAQGLTFPSSARVKPVLTSRHAKTSKKRAITSLRKAREMRKPEKTQQRVAQSSHYNGLNICKRHAYACMKVNVTQYYLCSFVVVIACRPLPDKILEKAKNELREDETRKQQALQHFREWLSKHPYIKEFRQGNKKFRMEKNQNN